MKEIQNTLKNYILKRLDTTTGIRSSKDIPELIYAYIELEHAQQGMANRPEVKSKIEVDKASVKIQGKKINVNQNCQEAQIKEEPCDAKAQIIEIITNEIGKPTRTTVAETLQKLLK
ncbi:hypothetical protein PK1910_06995 [Veillonella parvula]|uniref:hypothetical protein n=1 Tax=Veillonella parvula TaxID=29466 RepID=UPI00073D7CAD|nr:hypothetical protein AT982_02020 [Veillonella parvula]